MMLLARLSSCLKDMGRGSLKDISDKLNVESNALRAILRLLETKGLIAPVRSKSACGSCHKCDSKEQEIYQWIGS